METGRSSHLSSEGLTDGFTDLGDEVGPPVINNVRRDIIKAEDVLDFSSFTGCREFGKGYEVHGFANMVHIAEYDCTG